MTDLDKLIEAVEAGCVDPETPHAGMGWKEVSHMLQAYHGSLDAAKALHEALLPDCMWQRQPTGFVNIFNRDVDEIGCGYYKDNPARSWLIAILKAYRHSKNAHSSVHQRTP